MSVKEIMQLNRLVDEDNIAGHFADRISAVERNRTIALFEGDGEMARDLSKKILDLRKEARECGLDRERFPGIYR